MSRPVQFLRPCIHSSVRLKSVNALACCLPPLLCKTIKKRGISGAEVGDTARSSAKLLASNDPYPRYVSANNTASCQELLQHFKCLKNDEFANNDDVTIHGIFDKPLCFVSWLIFSGRIQTIRTAGLKLFFLDVNQDGYIVQGVLDFSNLQADEISFKNFDEASRTLKRGDIISRLRHR